MGLFASLPLISRILGKPGSVATRPTTVSVGTRATFPAFRAAMASPGATVLIPISAARPEACLPGRFVRRAVRSWT